MRSLKDAKELLPHREYYHAHEVANAFQVPLRSIHRISKRYSIGKKVPTQTGQRIYVFQEPDLLPLSQHLQPKSGRPVLSLQEKTNLIKKYELIKRKRKEGYNSEGILKEFGMTPKDVSKLREKVKYYTKKGE